MQRTGVKIVLMPGVNMPKYATADSAGIDLSIHSFKSLHVGDSKKELVNEETIILRDAQRVLIGTGIFVELEPGTEMQIRSRSGKALKQGLCVVNQPGTVDADYRGEVGVILINTSKSPIVLSKGDVVAQAVIAPFLQAEFQQVEKLTDTNRGEGGFGSTDANKV